MTLREYLRVLKDWMLPAGVLLGLLCAAVFAWSVTPTYAATTTLFVSAQGLQGDASRAYQGHLLSMAKVSTYTALIMSDRTRAVVGDRLHTQIAPGRITATAQPETVLITVTVTDTFPQRAQQIADAVGAESVELLAQLEKPADDIAAPPIVTTRVVQSPLLPVQQISPHPAWNLAVGAVAGLLLGYALALLRYVVNSSPAAVEPISAVGSTANLQLEDGTVLTTEPLRSRRRSRRT
ncbi:MAG: YveK family protein [Pseudonocardiaceae bacterium]